MVTGSEKWLFVRLQHGCGFRSVASRKEKKVFSYVSKMHSTMAAVLSILLVSDHWVHVKSHPENMTYWFPSCASHISEAVWFHLNTHSSVYSQDRLMISKHVEH